MNKSSLRRTAALCLSALTLWTSAVTAESESFSAALSQMHAASPLPQKLLQWELGDFSEEDNLSAATMLALQQSPLLLSQRQKIAELSSKPSTEKPSKEKNKPLKKKKPAKPQAQQLKTPLEGLQFRDNGVPAQTVHPTDAKGYTVVNGVYIKNSSSHTLNCKTLAPADFSARLSDDGPQVLIIHSHGSEAYSMPKGEEYKATGSFRTDNRDCNIVRIGDEVVSVLSSYGISALHDRTLHDVPDYNESYNNSYDAIEEYIRKYPSLMFILDIHRDAIADADGQQYKLVTDEDPRAAQVSLVMGSAYDTWEDNLKLAIAVQQHLTEDHPTLMRPISVCGYRYNQHFTPGSMLVEIGAAGNSLDEALYSARLFAKGFAETIQSK